MIVGRFFLIILGGFLIWVLKGCRLKNLSMELFGDENDEYDKVKQRNLAAGIIFIIFIAFVSSCTI
jgi:hypothetical protein